MDTQKLTFLSQKVKNLNSFIENSIWDLLLFEKASIKTVDNQALINIRTQMQELISKNFSTNLQEGFKKSVGCSLLGYIDS